MTTKTYGDLDWALETDIRERVVTYHDLWVKFKCPLCDHEQDWRNLFEPRTMSWNKKQVLETKHIVACTECHVYFEIILKFDGEGEYTTETYTMEGPVVAMA